MSDFEALKGMQYAIKIDFLDPLNDKTPSKYATVYLWNILAIVLRETFEVKRMSCVIL